MHVPHQHSRVGYITIAVIVFGTVFTVVLGGLVGFILVQNHAQNIKESRERALQIAEAGLDYYKWYLAHFPGDLQNGTGQPGPYQIPYHDPEGGQIGVFELDITGQTFCGETDVVEIQSTGWTLEHPNAERIVFGKYARPSVAEYSFIINANVWAGDDRVIVGPYHSNGGIRMDGTHNALVTSAVDTWSCTSSFGCNPASTTPGVWGGGPNSNLWEYPVPQVDFVGITTDLVQLKDVARDDGVYLEPTAQGKRLVFLPDGTVDVHIVNSTDWVWGFSSQDGWHQNNHIIDNDTFIGNFIIPADCPVIFAESDLWLEGTVNGKITVASANLIQPNNDTSIIINDNITYVDEDSGLTAVAEEDVLIPLLSPANMQLNGIFIAQNGRFGRNHYTTSGSREVPSQYDAYVIQDTLDIVGTVVSNGRVGTRWTSGGTTVSGYENRTASVDTNLATNPPPLTPTFSDEFTFVQWQEVE